MPRLQGKRVAVTGGAGFIGSHLVDRIALEVPEALVVIDDFSLGRESNLAVARSRFPSLRVHRTDASDLPAMRSIFESEGVEVVFALAVIPLGASLELPERTVRINVSLATTACELLRRGCYRTLVHVSSSEAYGTAQVVPMDEGHPLRPLTPYAASKAAADHIVLAYRATFGLDLAVVRPFNTYGPRQNIGSYAGVVPIFIENALRGRPLVVYGDGDQTRDFIFVRDTAEAIFHAYEREETRGLVVNVASGEATTVNGLARAILTATGADVPIQHGPPRPADVRRHRGDTALARRLLSFAPHTDLSSGLSETVAWYREHLAAMTS